MGLPFDFTIADTVALARILLPQLNRFKLDTVAKAVGVSLDHHHRAVDDAACTAEIFVKFIEMLHERGMETLDDVNQMGATSPELVKKLKSLSRDHTGDKRYRTHQSLPSGLHVAPDLFSQDDRVCQRANL